METALERNGYMKVSYLGMTGYDGPAPGFEVWPAPSTYCDPAIAHASIERTLTLCEKADALGFDWVSVSRSEEHTSELQSLMRISYAVFCLKKKKKTKKQQIVTIH